MLSCSEDSLESLYLVPRSRRPKLGQHFLADSRYRARIVEALHLFPGDTVIEIGAGNGAMTEILAERAEQVIALELDSGLSTKLREKLRDNPRIEVLEADILRKDVGQICQGHDIEKCFVFGNLPYYITSPILHHVLGFSSWIRGMGLLVQREVARRIVAAPGTRDYGYLSVLTQLYSRPHLALNVPPGAFTPAPKVQSSLVVFEMTSRFPDWTEQQFEEFLDFMKLCFAQKRKNLLNNLAAQFPRAFVERELLALEIPQSIRAEQLTLEQFANIFRGLKPLPS